RLVVRQRRGWKRAMAWKRLPEREGVIQREARPYLPRRTRITAVHRHEQTHRAHEMRRIADQRFAFGERFVDEAELAVLQIAQAAVDQARRARRRARAEVVALDEQRLVPVECRFARDAGAVDPAADNDDIE